MVTADAGASVALDGDASGAELLFGELPGRAVVETTDPAAVEAAFDGVAPVTRLGSADDSGALDVAVDDESLRYDAADVADLRDLLARELD